MHTAGHKLHDVAVGSEERSRSLEFLCASRQQSCRSEGRIHPTVCDRPKQCCDLLARVHARRRRRVRKHAHTSPAVTGVQAQAQAQSTLTSGPGRRNAGGSRRWQLCRPSTSMRRGRLRRQNSSVHACGSDTATPSGSAGRTSWSCAPVIWKPSAQHAPAARDGKTPTATTLLTCPLAQPPESRGTVFASSRCRASDRPAASSHRKQLPLGQQRNGRGQNREREASALVVLSASLYVRSGQSTCVATFCHSHRSAPCRFLNYSMCAQITSSVHLP